MSRRRILVLTKTARLGGAERLLMNALPWLDREAFDYRFAAFDADGPLASACADAGLPLDPIATRATRLARAVRALRARLVRERIDLVHAHLPLPGAIARLATRGLPVRVVYTEHNVVDRYRASSRWLNRLTYGWQDAVVAVSERVCESAVRTIGARARARAQVVPNGIDPERLDAAAARGLAAPLPDAAPGALRLLVPGTLEPRKGQDVLIRALARLDARGAGGAFELWLAGDGRSRAALGRRARQLGLGDRVRFLGRRTDVFAVMRAADLVVLPSRHEGHPLALLEAMALGRPCLAAAVGGIPEIVREGYTGLLVPPEDPAALADALLRLRADPALRDALGAAAARDVRARFHVRRTVTAVEAVYRRCLEA
jgi:glycosyltransferase involved in cell wall biosynthesis